GKLYEVDSPDSVEKIARELGLSEEQLRRIQKEFERAERKGKLVIVYLTSDGKVEIREVTSEEELEKILKKLGVDEEIIRRIKRLRKEGQIKLVIIEGSLEHHHHHH
uniref:NF6 n=1 Tax=synthetic construct TaxID=32630 RepID=UPI001AA00CD5|nr:Chain A, NF6 [synthetic construct]